MELPTDHGQSEDDRTETIEPVASDGALPAAWRMATGGFVLIVASGPRRGLHWDVGEGLTAGRDPEANIFLDDVTVSRHHAAFTVTDGELSVQDLGSTNGTYVNGLRTESAVLNQGDQVIIGRYHLVVARSA